MLTSFRYIGLSEYITKINFTYLILLFLNVTTKNCEIVYMACLCSSHCISIGKHGGNWPVTPKDIQVLLWNLWLLPHMAKGTLQMWLRIWKIILDYLDYFGLYAITKVLQGGRVRYDNKREGIQLWKQRSELFMGAAPRSWRKQRFFPGPSRSLAPTLILAL